MPTPSYCDIAAPPAATIRDGDGAVWVEARPVASAAGPAHRCTLADALQCYELDRSGAQALRRADPGGSVSPIRRRGSKRFVTLVRTAPPQDAAA